MISKFKSLSYSMGDSLVQFFGLLLFRVFLMREMSLQDFGVFTILFSIGTLVSSFIQGYTDKAFVKFYAESEDPKYIKSAILINIFLGLILSVVMLAGSGLLTYIYKNEFNALSLIPVAGIVISNPIRYIGKSIFSARLQFKLVFFQSLYWVVLLNGGVFLLDKLHLLTTDMILIMHVIANILLLIIIIFQIIMSHIVIPFKSSVIELKKSIFELLHFGKYSLGISIAFLFYTQVDTLLIGALLGTTEVSLYEVPKRIFTFARLYSNSISQLLFPKIAKLKGFIEKQRILFFSTIKLGAIGGFFLAVLSYFLLPSVIPLLFGDKYISVISVSQLVSLFFIVHPISNFSGNALGALNRPREDLKTLLITFVLNIILDLILIPPLGIAGAAYATLATVALAGAINFNKVIKILNGNEL